MSNHHARLKQLEKLANEKRVKAKGLAARTEQDKLQKEVAELTDEELNARYQAVQDELSAHPIDQSIAQLSSQQLIEKYQQLCKEN